MSSNQQWWCCWSWCRSCPRHRQQRWYYRHCVLGVILCLALSLFSLLSAQPFTVLGTDFQSESSIIPGKQDFDQQAITLSLAVQELESFRSRYYIYTSNEITQDKQHHIRGVFERRYGLEAEYERLVIATLRNHSLRTDDPNEADLFIVPIPMSTILISHGLSYDDAFNALLKEPMFRKHQGENHIMMSAALVTYSHPNAGNVPQLRGWYKHLANVTAAISYDPIACERSVQDGLLTGNDYESVFNVTRPMAHHIFSTGLGDSHTVPFLRASMEKFRNATHHIFYYTRPEPSLFDATRFRHAPILNVSWDTLPRSSIGFSTTKEQWLEDFVNSQFCLVIRGDTPHSHAFIRSIKVGCIPVVISDLLPIYAPIFKSTLNMSDYCIFIQEQDFIENPTFELSKLQHLSQMDIQLKIAALAFAQRVTVPDHPESLYVPAYLKEAQKAMEYRAVPFF